MATMAESQGWSHHPWITTPDEHQVKAALVASARHENFSPVLRSAQFLRNQQPGRPESPTREREQTIP